MEKERFEDWSRDYDGQVKKETFPFKGYEKIKEAIRSRIPVNHSTQILDLGVGTGNLTKPLYDKGAQIYALDFSEKMLEKAREKMKSALLIHHDIGMGLPEKLKRAKFDAIIAGFVLHHFNFEKKFQLIKEMIPHLKVENGRLLIADVSFQTREAMNACRRKYGQLWDEEEDYFVAAQLTKRIDPVQYTQISECCGIYEIPQQANISLQE